MKPGAYPGLSDAEYDAIEAVRSSALNRFASATPAHYWHADQQADEEREWKRWGRAFHVATFQPDRFSELVGELAIMPTAQEMGFKDFRTKEAREARDWKQAEVESVNAAHEEAGRTLLDPDEMTEVLYASQNMREHEVIAPLLKLPHEVELTLVWQDRETGLPCKARLDFGIKPEPVVVVELKSYRDIVTPETVRREIARRGYHRQAGWYRRGIREVYGAEVADRVSFLMGWSEKKSPYLAAVRPLELEAIDRGELKMTDALKQFAQCKRTNRWPGVSSDGAWEIPDWCDAPEDDLTFGDPDTMEDNLL